MGKIIVKNVILRNHKDEIAVELKVLDPKHIRECQLDMIADTGARAIGLPLPVIEQLGLEKKRTVTTTLSDGSQQQRDLYGDLKLQIGDRDSVFTCIGKPKEAPCLIGQIVLEELDFIVDCPNQRLLPNPEAPEGELLFEDF